MVIHECAHYHIQGTDRQTDLYRQMDGHTWAADSVNWQTASDVLSTALPNSSYSPFLACVVSRAPASPNSLDFSMIVSIQSKYVASLTGSLGLSNTAATACECNKRGKGRGVLYMDSWTHLNVTKSIVTLLLSWTS